MTPQELKNSILQLAIQGKLVAQDPNDEPASVLLDRIHEEKAKSQNIEISKSRKTSKSRNYDTSKLRNEITKLRYLEISEDEKPFDIPAGWKWVRLGEIGTWGAGATPSRTNPDYYGGSIPWLKTGDLNDGLIHEVSEHITNLALEKTSVKLNPVGSVLMAMYGATIGKLGILEIEATTNQACCACIPYSVVDKKYLFYFLMARRASFIKMGEGGAQPNISKEKIVAVPIPLPPLAEQKRIVEKLEQLLPLCERIIK